MAGHFMVILRKDRGNKPPKTSADQLTSNQPATNDDRNPATEASSQH
jgi:hypothetical protein